MKQNNLFRLLLTILHLLLLCTMHANAFEHFISRNGNRLYDGDSLFRFISFNVPNLHLLEDDFAFTNTNQWSLPTTFEIHDAMKAVQQVGGTVIRQYCLRVHRRHDPAIGPEHLTSWRTYDEAAFRVMDSVLAIAGEYGIRIIIPFLEGPPWWGAKKTFACLRDGNYHFESDSVKNDYRHLVKYICNRRNSVTGIQYKNDKTILCWETGNEMNTSSNWLSEMTEFIKSVDSNHLIMDGNYGIRSAALDDPNIDIVSNHYYKKSAHRISRDIHKIREKKAYIAGEWGWSLKKTEEVIPRIINSSASGACIWSLRYRYRNGGFTWHHGEGMHWPGGFLRNEMVDEEAILKAVRNGAFTIRGLSLPPISPPSPPNLLPVIHPSLISWQGSTGALTYHIERSPSPEGPWNTIDSLLDETVIAYRSMFSDTSVSLDREYFYRMFAHNSAGSSEASAIVGPVLVTHHTLVDEFIPSGKKHHLLKGTAFTSKKPYQFKYDFHRMKGSSGDIIEYKCDGSVSEVRLFAYFPGNAKDVSIMISQNDSTFIPSSVQRTSFPYCCTNPRDRLALPVLFTAVVTQNNSGSVRIVFPRGRMQAGRCEIDYK
ncbi:MAG: cellulase family glycosylhydrolase [Fibrobacter sp.]|nr:cellulase family glycosylhydrolase [Fibrobacter sp.]